MAFARNSGVKIVNCSFNGGLASMQGVNNEMQMGKSQDVLYIFSAGNAANQNTAGVDVDTGQGTSYPCNWNDPNLICVTAVDRFGNRPFWANYGVKGVDLGAPGVDLYSTLNGSDNHYGKSTTLDNSFPPGSGTSYAAPHVTGVAALLKAKHMNYTYSQLKEAVLLGASPVLTGALDGRTHTGGMLNADMSILAFGDSFDDALSNVRFFSQLPTSSRWAVGQKSDSPNPNPEGKCDNFTRQIVGTADQVTEVSYSGVVGTSGSDFTLAAYESVYTPGASVQTLEIRITTTDGSSLAGKSGRIAVGVVGDELQTSRSCQASGQSYTKMNFGGSMFGGIELHTGKPFVYFDPPYVESTYSAINLTNRSKLTILLTEEQSTVILRILDSVTGEELAYNVRSYPSPWNWTGTDKAAFLYYGTTAQSGSLYVRSFLSTRP